MDTAGSSGRPFYRILSLARTDFAIFALSFGAAIILMACRSGARPGVTDESAPPSPRPRVIVQEFDTTGAMVEDIEGTVAPLGRRVAEAVAENLQWWEYDATTARQASPGKGRLLVEGRITSVDGGNRAVRWAAGFGAGALSLSVQGRVVGEDGRVLGEFESTQTGDGGLFGGSYDGLLDYCIDSAGAEIAEMVVEKEYPFSATVGQPWDPALYAPTHEAVDQQGSPPGDSVLTAEERLRQLDELHSKGLITDQERKAHRQKILGDL